MIGLFKFLLSLLVIASHTNYYLQIPGFHWFNQGISAVIPFFILSGYFSSLIIDKKTPNQIKVAGYLSFLKSRFIKIAPQFYFYALLVFLFVFISQPQNLNVNLSAILANLSIIALNLHQYFKISLFKNSYYDGILPPAWYLASLFQYYLIIPFISKSKLFNLIAWILSGSVFILALLNFIPNNYYSYRFIGNFVFFLTGSLIYQKLNHHPKKLPYLLIVIYIAFILFTLYQFQTQQIYQLHTNAPILFGFLVFAPPTYFLLKKTLSHSISKIDNFLSTLSFSIYLNHYIFVYVFDHYQIANSSASQKNLLRFALTTFYSVILAIFINYSPSLVSKLKSKIKNKA